MQPDNQNNYWEQDSGNVGPDKITETYTPAPMPDNPTDADIPDTDSTPIAPVIDNNPVHWSASEYISDNKNWLWFVMFIIAVLALIAVDVFLMKSYTFSILVVVMAVAIIIFSHRPPRVIDYTLSGDQGLYIGDKLHHFSEFKSFGLIRDRGQHSIMLIPTKRFSPGVSVYFPDEVGEKIVDILGARLPMEDLKLDIVDIIVQKLRL